MSNKFDNLSRIYYKEYQNHEPFLEKFPEEDVIHPDSYKTSESFSFDYSDLPSHWQYLQQCVPLYSHPLARRGMPVIVVERYKNAAIAYSSRLQQPIIIFRHLDDCYDLMIRGKQFFVKVYRMFVSPIEPAYVFTDLFGVVVRLYNWFYRQEIYLSDRDVIVRKVAFEWNGNDSNLRKIRNFHVVYTVFGSIVIPPLYSELISSLKKNVSIVGEVKYCLRGITENEYSCWQLCDKFKIYSDLTLYAIYENGVFEKISKKDRNEYYTLKIDKKKVLTMVINHYEEKEDEVEVKKRIDVWSKYLCVDADTFVTLALKQKKLRNSRRK